MFVLKDYQEKAVQQLTEQTCDALQAPGRRIQMLLKAPTGAGKTVTMAAFLARMVQELGLRPGLPASMAFIWIAPNTLHLQSYAALTGFFSQLNELDTLQVDDLSNNSGLGKNNLLFLNWSSVDKEKNIFRRDNEQNFNLQTLVETTRNEGTELMVLIDEAHYSAFKGDQARKVLQLIDAKIEVSITATPEFVPDLNVIIQRQKVVEAQMIKKGVRMNTGLTHDEQMGEMLDLYLLRKAMARRDALASAYREAGIPFNPLLLIQLPSDNKSLDDEDKRLKVVMETYLDGEYGITTQNGLLAVWLSDDKEKQNLEGLEYPQAMQKVLLFKQAIAQGWDCPRAAVLLIFRNIGTPTFGIQTVGRILRMPEQKHYDNDDLNYGYVYTNLQNNVIRFVAEDLDFFSLQASTRKSHLPFSVIPSAIMVNDRPTPGYLTSDFKNIFFKRAEAKYHVVELPEIDLFNQEEVETYKKLKAFNYECFAANFWQLDVEAIEISIPTDVQVDDYEKQAYIVNADQMEGFEKSQPELSAMLDRFCYQAITRLNRSKSFKLLRSTLIEYCEYYMGIFESEARKVLLHPNNQPLLVELINESLELYDIWQKEKGNNRRRKEEIGWEVPIQRYYPEIYNRDNEVTTNALEPYYEYQEASSPEIKFKEELEKNADHILWWYKNGDKGKEHFAVAYQSHRNEELLFYVDFVVCFKSGVLGLYDTKTRNSDAEAPNKHNALIEYIESQNKANNDKKLTGSILITEITAGITRFRWCRNRIDNTNDLQGWEYFNPATLNP
jgi:type III restriction enzyme